MLSTDVVLVLSMLFFNGLAAPPTAAVPEEGQTQSSSPTTTALVGPTHSSTPAGPPLDSLDPPHSIFSHLENNQTEGESPNGVIAAAASCEIKGVHYEHGAQVSRKDPCEFCLCLDGELFCWWQDCPTPGACKSNCSSAPMPTLTSMGTPPPVSRTTIEVIVTERNDSETTEEELKSTLSPNTVCLVMGTEYAVGEILPRDPGTCLECVCGSEARVTCAPKDCAPREDYRRNSLDMFDVDTF